MIRAEQRAIPRQVEGKWKFWNDGYRSRDQLFSGNPNGVIGAEVAGLPPGRAPDAGCGKGADAC